MDMSLFDAPNEIKSTLGRRDHRNKRFKNPEDVSDLKKKANKRDKPRDRNIEEEEE